MKNRIKHLLSSKNERVITTFGRARLVTLPNGTLQLIGGLPEDKTAAKEWISLFMHEAVVRFPK